MSASAAVTLEGLLALAEDPERLAEVRPVLRLLAGLEDKQAPVGAMQSTTDAADRLGYCTRTIERWCRAGLIPGAVKIEGTWRVPVGAMPAPSAPAVQPAPTPVRATRVRKARARATGVQSSAEDAIRGPLSGTLRRGKTTPRSAPASAGTDRGRGPIGVNPMDMQNSSAARNVAGASVTPITKRGGTR